MKALKQQLKRLEKKGQRAREGVAFVEPLADGRYRIKVPRLSLDILADNEQEMQQKTQHFITFINDMDGEEDSEWN